MYITRQKRKKKRDPLAVERSVIVGDIITERLSLITDTKKWIHVPFHESDRIMLDNDYMIVLTSAFCEEQHHHARHKLLAKKFKCSVKKNDISIVKESACAFLLKKIAPHNYVLILIQDRDIYDDREESCLSGHAIRIDEKDVQCTQKMYTIEHKKDMTQSSRMFNHVPQLRFLINHML